jgi:hypothetical protein
MKVQKSIHYYKPYIETDKDMLRLQTALLYKRVPFLTWVKKFFK